MGNNEGKSLEAADSNEHKNNVDHQYKQIFYDLIIERILEKLGSKPKFGNLMRIENQHRFKIQPGWETISHMDKY